MPRETKPIRHADAKHPNRYWGATPLPKSKAEFFNAITTPAPAADGSNIATIRLYGPIDSWGGYWGISAKDVGAVIDALPTSVSQIILRINSPGGEVWEGTTILNMLRAHSASVTAVVDGIAASAASFIAAGCDETVMSPGTQMMVHSVSSFAFGNATDMRKMADTLDMMNRAIAEIYTEKAGEKDWPSILDDETWMTANETVAFGLADRVAVIPDAGETATVGDETDEVVVLPDEDEPEDSAAARVLRIVARATKTPTRPVSTEPGNPNRTENAVAYSDLKAGIRKRLGVTDTEPTDEMLFAALDEVLAEQPSNTITTPPAGTVLVDEGRFKELEASAQAGVQALAQQDTARRDQVVADALADGRISAATRQAWRDSLDSNESVNTALLGSLPKNKVPMKETGHSDQPEVDEVYDALFPDEKKGA